MSSPVAVPVGLCEACRHVSKNETRRGPVYYRCTRANWDDRLVRYPRLPVLTCVGFTPADGPGEPGS